MNAQKDLWSYGAYDIADGEFYGPLEVLELEDVQEALRKAGITIHDDELVVGDEEAFELQDGTRVDVEGFTYAFQQTLFSLGYEWDSVA